MTLGTESSNALYGVDARLGAVLSSPPVMPRASVVVATYNAPHYLRLVLASLQVQTARDFEVIVSDDGSKPETRELVTSLQKTALPYALKYHWQEDTGYRLGEARNGGVRLSEADWVIFLDGDMVVHRRFVETNSGSVSARSAIGH